MRVASHFRRPVRLISLALNLAATTSRDTAMFKRLVNNAIFSLSSFEWSENKEEEERRKALDFNVLLQSRKRMFHLLNLPKRQREGERVNSKTFHFQTFWTSRSPGSIESQIRQKSWLKGYNVGYRAILNIFSSQIEYLQMDEEILDFAI